MKNTYTKLKAPTGVMGAQSMYNKSEGKMQKAEFYLGKP